jgi:hypothetical protein
MRVADHRFQTAGEGLVGENGVKEDRQLRRGDLVALRRR